ncbi:OpgC domain-containing protein [Paracoccus sp. Z118]|uniref:OpgC domain-containing protein n=1 Tax=Paracoccus sp. Z118 TaxID=2851017 RepID=UPI001C2BEA4E|nr:OpgC domain-containing protein [Paracoccus sp. Z118]MBV0892817.1 OpgC domain-containing protein [Paracoccus sp. Z118]
MNRIPALDMLRGYALVAIMLNHMPAGVLRQFTLTNYTIFDAAELFVLLSGFLVGLVWLKTHESEGLGAAQWRFARRAVQVWLALIAGAVLIALLSGALTALDLKHTAVWTGYGGWLAENPLGYLGVVASLWMQPNLVDVLALYVVLMASVPLLVPLLERRPLVFALLSLAVWMAAVPLNAALPNERHGGGLLFNPFGWQVLFYAGVAMGLFRRSAMPVLRRWSGAVTVLALGVALYGTAMAVLWRFGPEGKRLADVLWHAVGKVDKWSLDEMRLAAVLAWAWLVAVPLAAPMAWLSGTAAGRALAVVGRGGLVTFVACVLLSILGDAMATNPAGTDTAWKVTVDLLVVALLWLIGLGWLHRARIGAALVAKVQTSG